jgi:hypothetical protein
MSRAGIRIVSAAFSTTFAVLYLTSIAIAV